MAADPLLEMLVHLGDPIMTVDAAERGRWHQPVVYAWLRGDEVLYIGCSARGIERPMAASHEKLREFQPGDRVAIWASSDPFALEEKLIRRWRPRYNKPNGGEPCPGCGGRMKPKDRAAHGCCDMCARRRANGLRWPAGPAEMSA